MGDVVFGSLVGNDFYGYSKSGITAFNIVFGSRTFDLSEILSLAGPGFEADFFVDKPLGVATPSLFWMGLASGLEYFMLGDGFSDGNNVLMMSSDAAVFEDAGTFTRGAITEITVDQAPAQVPEPASMALLGAGLLALSVASRRRRQARDGV